MYRGLEYKDMRAGVPRKGSEKKAEPDRFYLLGRAEAALTQREKDLARQALEVLLTKQAVDERLLDVYALQMQILGLLSAMNPAMQALMGPPAAAPPALPEAPAMPGGGFALPQLPEPPAGSPGFVVPPPMAG